MAEVQSAITLLQERRATLISPPLAHRLNKISQVLDLTQGYRYLINLGKVDKDGPSFQTCSGLLARLVKAGSSSAFHAS